MPTLPGLYRPPGLGPQVRSPRKERDQRRGSSCERGYDAWWQRQRAAHLMAHPLCVCCKANGVVRTARVVDHVVPHRGDEALFRDPANRQSLCDECHNTIKATLERRYDAGEIGASELRLDRPLPEFFYVP